MLDLLGSGEFVGCKLPRLGLEAGVAVVLGVVVVSVGVVSDMALVVDVDVDESVEVLSSRLVEVSSSLSSLAEVVCDGLELAVVEATAGGSNVLTEFEELLLEVFCFAKVVLVGWSSSVIPKKLSAALARLSKKSCRLSW